MAVLSLIFYDAEEAYAASLAAGMKHYLRGQAVVHLVKNREDLFSCFDYADGTVLISGDISLCDLKRFHANLQFCYLASEEYETDSGANVRWDYCLYKYQSVQVMSGALLSKFGFQNRVCQRQSDQIEEWYGIISPAHHDMEVPYSLTMAAILAERKRVLWVGLTEFCGIDGLLGLERMQDAGELFQLLRTGSGLDNEQKGCMIWMDNLGILEPPENPMILYELQENDILNLSHYIRKYGHAEAVVWLIGNIFPGSIWLLKQCRRILSLEKNDTCSQCINQEFHRFLEKMGQEEALSCERVMASSLLDMEPGIHLLQQWVNSSMGGEIRKYFGKEQEH